MKIRYALIAAATVLVGVANAQTAAKEARGPDMERMALLLELDDSQKVEVERILKAHHEKVHAAREEMRKSDTRPSREEMKQLRATHKQEVKAELQNVLTPEQLKKFEALTDHSHHGRRRHAE